MGLSIRNEDPTQFLHYAKTRDRGVRDTKHGQKHNGDPNATLILVRFRVPFHRRTALTIFSGWSIFCGQLRFRHRHPIQSSTKISASDQKHKYLRAVPSLDRSAASGEDPTVPVCEPPDVTAGRIHRDDGQAMAEPVPPALRRVNVKRCGNRQRKFNGLGKWPFCTFIETLPVILQIVLLSSSSPAARRGTRGQSTLLLHMQSPPLLLSETSTRMRMSWQPHSQQKRYILLCQLDQALRNTKHRLAQEIPGFRGVGPLPTTLGMHISSHFRFKVVLGSRHGTWGTF